MPTAHVWGKTDPYADAARELSMLCRSDTKSVFVHSGGHEVPGAGSKDAVTSIVNVIRRTNSVGSELTPRTKLCSNQTDRWKL
jgi:hypothetical protein